MEGVLTCINAVAMITPEPKYFVIKKARGGTRMRFVRAAIMGNRAPKLNQLVCPNNHLAVEHTA